MYRFLTVFLCTLFLAGCSSSQNSIDGLWYGAIIPPEGEVDPVRFSNQDEGPVADNGTATVTGDALRIHYPSGAVYRGVVGTSEGKISGFYVQPGNQIGGQRLAHYLPLVQSGDDQWAATPTPLQRQFSLSIDIDISDGEQPVATLLNRERNITGPNRSYGIKQTSEDTYELVPPGSSAAFTSFMYDPKPDTISIGFGPIDAFSLRRIAPDDPIAAAFYGDDQPAEITQPQASASWPTALPETVGMDAAALAELVDTLASESALEERPNLVHSLLVAREGKLVLESYFRGYDKDTPHDMRSAGKTFASVLVGALRQDGIDLAIDTPIDRFIPMAGEPSIRPVTLGDLLTHRSGVECDDANGDAAGGENAMWNQGDYENFWAFTASLAQVAEPGTRYAYCSGGINLVGAALSGATGESVLSLMHSKLLAPMGFKNAYLNTMPNNEAYLGGGAHLRPRDLLKLGQLYLNDGQWNGQQLVDPEWVAQSLTPQVGITPETTGLSEENFGRFYFGGRDGLAWHIFTVTVDGKSYETFEASGNGGQIVVIVPELDLAVALTGGNYGQGYIWGKWRQQIIGDRIIAAIL